MRPVATGMLLAALAAAMPGAEPADEDVRVYLPRVVRVDRDELTLEQVGVVLSAAPQREQKARAVTLGRAPWPRETLTIDRTTVLARLASAGIGRQSVRFSGADAVAVCRAETTIRAEALLAAAEEHLKKTAPGGRDCIHRIVGKGEDVTVPGAAAAELVCSLAPAAAHGYVKVEVAVSRDGKVLARREVLFQRLHAVKRAVVVKEVAAGQPLTADNVEVQTTYSPRAPQEQWASPLERLAVRRLAQGTVLRDGMTTQRRPQFVIERNQVVRMRIEGAGFTITATGQALESGRPGEFIKVRNADTRQVVTARVALDGVVEPVYPK